MLNYLGLNDNKMAFNNWIQADIVYFGKYFPRLWAFKLMSANLLRISRQSRGVVASAFLAYTGTHQVENIYKDGLYNQFLFIRSYYPKG